MYSCYKIINPTGNLMILKMFSQLHGLVVYCDHITHSYPDSVEPPPLTSIEATGVIYDKDSSGNTICGIMVDVNGKSTRPDGKQYHITVALSEGMKPKQTNDAIERGKVLPLARNIKLNVNWFKGVLQN